MIYLIADPLANDEGDYQNQFIVNGVAHSVWRYQREGGHTSPIIKTDVYPEDIRLSIAEVV